MARPRIRTDVVQTGKTAGLEAYPRTEMVGLGAQLKTERDRGAKDNYGISDLGN